MKTGASWQEIEKERWWENRMDWRIFVHWPNRYRDHNERSQKLF